MIAGSVTTAAPTYTTGNINPLSLTTSGLLRVDGSGVTQPVSGTFWQATQPVSIAATVAVTDNAGSLTVDNGGTFAVQAAQSGTWNITNVSGTVSLPTGAATEASLAKLTVTQNASTTGVTLVGNGAFVTTSAPSYTTAQVSALSLTTSGALRVDIGATSANGTAIKVDGSAVTQPVSGTFWQATQPVSGTVTANAGTGTFAISAASLPLPTGAATAAKQPALGTAGSASTDVLTVQGISGGTAMNVAVVSGGGEALPTSPVRVYVKTTDLAAGASTTTAHQTSDLTTGTYYCAGFDVSSSIPLKAALHTVLNGVQSTDPITVVFSEAGGYASWQPPHRYFAAFTSANAAGFDGFRLILTNLDGSEAADVYSSIYYQS